MSAFSVHFSPHSISGAALRSRGGGWQVPHVQVPADTLWRHAGAAFDAAALSRACRTRRFSTPAGSPGQGAHHPADVVARQDLGLHANRGGGKL